MHMCYQFRSNRGLDRVDQPATSLDLSRSTFKRLRSSKSTCKLQEKKKLPKKNDALNPKSGRILVISFDTMLELIRHKQYSAMRIHKIYSLINIININMK